MLIIFPDELEVLRSMQPLDRDVFNYLAERMDYETGLIGKSRKVSYGGIAYDLTEHDGERRKADTLQRLNRFNAINSVERLVKAGLFKRLSKPGKHESLMLGRVFFVDLLHRDESVQKPVNTQLIQQMLQLKKLLSIVNNNLDDNNQDSKYTKSEAVNRTSFTQQRRQADDEFVMFLEWQPILSDFEFMLFKAGFHIDQIKPEWMTEFISYWYGEGKRQYNQRQWTVRLAAKMIDYLRQPGLYEQLRGTNKVVAFKSNKGGNKPCWSVLPRDDENLESWAIKNGFPKASNTMDNYYQYRKFLEQKIELRKKQEGLL